MVLKHLILARDTSIDREKNTVSIFELIEELSVSSPAAQVSFHVQLLLILERGRETGALNDKVNVSIFTPSGEVVMDTDVAFVMNPEHKRTRIRINIELPIAQSGECRFRARGPDFDQELTLPVTFHRETPAPASGMSN